MHHEIKEVRSLNIFFDLTQAFDTINHLCLLEITHSNGLWSLAADWL